MVRAFPIVILLALMTAGAARAQSAAPPQGGFAPPQGGGAPGQGAVSPQQALCQQLVLLHEATEKRGMAVQAAFKRKATAQEACGLIKAFADDESKMIKFVEQNGVWCGIPAEVVKQMKAGQARTAMARTNACNAAAAPKPAPLPTLGDALGTTRVPDASNTKTGRGGAFDTLNGNPIAR